MRHFNFPGTVLGIFFCFSFLGGGAYFLHGAQTAHIIDRHFVLTSQAWSQSGMGMMIVGGFVMLLALVILLLFQMQRLRDELNRA